MIPTSGALVLVQRIITSWTKSTRGADGREARARLPQGYPLPDEVLVSRAPCTRHVVNRGEHGEYRPSATVQLDEVLRAALGIATTSIELREVDAVLRVSFRCEGDTGAPRREPMSMTLESGTWGRVHYNGRFTSHESSWYESKIVNVAYGIPPRRDLFEAGEPNATLDARVDLW